MDHNAFVELANREITRRIWWEEARDVIKDLGLATREREKAEAARDAAYQARDEALADLEAAREKAAKAAIRERTEHAAMLARDQAVADAAVAKAQAQLRELQAAIDQTRVLVTLAEEERDRRVAALTEDVATLTASRDALAAEERAIRERLAAALGR